MQKPERLTGYPVLLADRAEAKVDAPELIRGISMGITLRPLAMGLVSPVQEYSPKTKGGLLTDGYRRDVETSSGKLVLVAFTFLATKLPGKQLPNADDRLVIVYIAGKSEEEVEGFVEIFDSIRAAKSPAFAPTASSHDIQPRAAVIAAADHPISGVFRLQVRGAGRQDRRLFLNSESDYRDPRCLTIAIPGDVAEALGATLGGDPVVILKGKTIRVNGRAERVMIRFSENAAAPPNAYYFQTHVRIEDISQIEVLK